MRLQIAKPLKRLVRWDNPRPQRQEEVMTTAITSEPAEPLPWIPGSDGLPIPQSAAVSAYFYPYLQAEPVRVIHKQKESPAVSPDDGLPIPPRHLHAGYGMDSDHYLVCGRENHQMMMEIMGGAGLVIPEGARILDFGCAGGRVIRCFKDVADRYEIWGVDIRADHIFWCQQHLSPPFRFTTTTTQPHLPFEDGSFQFIYACSIFTHIGDLEDAWLLEMRRILRPGGMLFATVHDNHTIDLILSSPPDDWKHHLTIRRLILEADAAHGMLKSGYDIFQINVEPGNHQVFHDREFLRKRWGRLLDVVAIHPEGHTYQTAVVLRK